MNAQNSLKKTGYCVTEIKAMVRVIFDNATVIKNSGGEVPAAVFEKIAQATEGKRTVDMVRLWYYNLKKIRDHEKRWTVIVQEALTSEEQSRLHEIMFSKGLQLGDALENMSLYPFLQKQMEYEDQEEMDIDKENSMDSTGHQAPPPYEAVNLQAKEAKKKGIGCFSFTKKESPYYPAPSAPVEGPTDTTWYHELGAEKQETVYKEHHF